MLSAAAGAVSWWIAGFFTLSATTSLGLSDVDDTPTISPFLLTDVTDSSCEPLVMGRTPPEYLKPGDVMEAEVDRIGVLRSRVVAAE